MVQATTGLTSLVPTYTVATLPAAGTSGRLAFVSDGKPIGLYLDNGSAWVLAIGNRNVISTAITRQSLASDDSVLVSAVGTTQTLPAIATISAGFRITIIDVSGVVSSSGTSVAPRDGALLQGLSGAFTIIASGNRNAVTFLFDGTDWHAT